ncbi:hypothetical protein ETAC_07335 [Edwardsiella piscicida C07-087]|nr:hypothetical protein ETAC_07335 [Edwardsiella piscicida C07-087]
MAQQKIPAHIGVPVILKRPNNAFAYAAATQARKNNAHRHDSGAIRCQHQM